MRSRTPGAPLKASASAPSQSSRRTRIERPSLPSLRARVSIRAEAAAPGASPAPTMRSAPPSRRPARIRAATLSRRSASSSAYRFAAAFWPACDSGRRGSPIRAKTCASPTARGGSIGASASAGAGRAAHRAKSEDRQRGRARRDLDHEAARGQHGPHRLDRGRNHRSNDGGRVWIAGVRGFAAQIEIERRDAIGGDGGEGAIARAKADVEPALRGADAEAILIGAEDALVAAHAGGVGGEPEKDERRADRTRARGRGVEFGPGVDVERLDGAAAKFARGDEPGLAGADCASIGAVGDGRRKTRHGAILQRRSDQKKRDGERGGEKPRDQTAFMEGEGVAKKIERAGALEIGRFRVEPEKGPRSRPISSQCIGRSPSSQRPIMKRFYGFGVVNGRPQSVWKRLGWTSVIDRS